MSDSDPVAGCYRALVGEIDADTCCKRICVMVRRIANEPDCLDHQLHFLVLAQQLLSETATFGSYVVELDACVRNGKYAAAILIGEAMVRHEAMLHDIVAERPMSLNSTIN